MYQKGRVNDLPTTQGVLSFLPLRGRLTYLVTEGANLPQDTRVELEPSLEARVTLDG